MTENEDKLLESFFADNRQEVADNGFTRRVMRRLPDRGNRLARVWTTVCFTLAAVLFVALDGIEIVWNVLHETFVNTVQSGAAQTDSKSLLIAGVVLLYLLYRKILRWHN